MKTFLISCGVAVVIALGAALLLNTVVQKPADEAFASPLSVRI